MNTAKTIKLYDIAVLLKENSLDTLKMAHAGVRSYLSYPHISKEIKDTLRSHLELIEKTRKQIKNFEIIEEVTFTDMSNLCKILLKATNKIYKGNEIRI